MDGVMDVWMDGGWTVGWTLGWTVVGRLVDGIQTFWNGMVTEGGREGHQKWTVCVRNRKIYCMVMGKKILFNLLV